MIEKIKKKLDKIKDNSIIIEELVNKIEREDSIMQSIQEESL